MFKRLFSCFNDANETQHIDLSKKGELNQFKPEVPHESNING
jgi:hypothetical protein